MYIFKCVFNDIQDWCLDKYEKRGKKESPKTRNV